MKPAFTRGGGTNYSPDAPEQNGVCGQVSGSVTGVPEGYSHPGNKKATRKTRVAHRLNRSSGRLLLRLDRSFSALEVSGAAFSLFSLVKLLAHKSLYIANPIRMLGPDYADSSFTVQQLFASGAGA